MRGPHVRFCERRGGAILRAYSTQPRRFGSVCFHEVDGAVGRRGEGGQGDATKEL